MTARVLAWDGCLNVRDLGGLRLAGGGATRFGQIVRADNVRRLTADGWSEVRRYGVRRIVDLRFVRDRADERPVPADLESIAISLFGDHDPAEVARADGVIARGVDDVGTIELFYLDTLERRRREVAAAVRAVASAPDGGVVVHCFVGKDRTGMVSALLLRVAGVPEEAVVEDYALSGPVVGPLVDGWIAAAGNERERTFRTRVSAAPAEGLRRTLQELRRRFGSEEQYLLDAGVSADDLARVRTRLVG